MRRSDPNLDRAKTRRTFVLSVCVLLAPGLNSCGSTAVPCESSISESGATNILPSSGIRQIAFEHRDGDHSSIWIIDEDGRNAKDLLPGFSHATEASFSPDGRVLLFSSNWLGDGDIYSSDLSTGQITRLTCGAGNDQSPEMSPDGQSIVFRSDRESASFDIWIMDSDGTNQRRLTTIDGYKAEPTFSPDGRFIAVQMDRPSKQIYVMNSDGTDIRNISGGGYGDRYPTWSPDGSKIAFTSVGRSDQSGDVSDLRQLFLMNADGSSQRVLVDDLVDSRHANWSPDGLLIAFDRLVADGTRQVFTVEPDGSGLRQVTSEGSNHKPAFRPIP